ncbi:MAG: cytochrome b [Gammaproteobacteria bacterium]|nr:cytochrome b [Gammaproteobacteria bacterium]MCW8840800.1 cytochrome b [Gammaproteobacteria bacterium]MCW8958827.1 cytochrome b [Gammaproteobacteria bacterium]MCW8972023.1 cytochrome b [Gammaproteobacteria bacterium]MCW8991936.1 cytochrome b [Gammaproteobacteria bacterium]
MHWRNHGDGWGAVAIALHWLSGLAVFGLFGLGLWMTGLDYYDSWYRKGPDLHRSIGVLLFIATLFRLLWRFVSPSPPALASHRPWERLSARATHALLYLLLFALMLSGYFISTADGRSIAVFDWFSLPATLTGEHQEDLAGEVHRVLAWSLIGLVALHAGAALKHHFIDRDSTLRRMLGL